MKMKDIHINPKNPRYIKDDRYLLLKKNLKEFPKMMKLRPIIIDDSGMILGGNMRYLAMIDLGYKEIPEGWVKKASDLTKEEREKFKILDNVPFGNWDFDILANEWDIDLLKPIIKKYKGRFVIFRNHAKIIAGIGNKFAFAVESSANINTNPRTENNCLTIAKGIYKFYKEYYDSIISFEKKERG